jgi:hypothetical protein
MSVSPGSTPHPARRLARTLASALAVACVALAPACGDDGGGADTGGDPGADGTFIAFTPDFASWRTWEKFPIGDGTAQGSTHLAGPRTEYLNKRPPKGSAEFPVGTIIVKELETGPVEQRRVFAMAKRGGGYNAASAPGWEWFELANNPDGSLQRIVWRGFGPPAGEQYGGDSNGCASCHAASRSNDFVASPQLSLSNF